jgi:hypothetical protein
VAQGLADTVLVSGTETDGHNINELCYSTSDSYNTNKLCGIPSALHHHQCLPSPKNSNLSCDPSSEKLKEIKDCKLYHMSVLVDAVSINWHHNGSNDLT